MHARKLPPPIVWCTTICCLFGLMGNVQAQTVTLQPVADADVASTKPTANYGYNGTLRIDTKRVSYLRFDLSALAGATIRNAELRLYQLNAAASGSQQKVHQMAATPWSESTLSWKNRPTTVEATLATFYSPKPTLPDQSWITFNTTAGVAAYVGRSVTLAVTGTNTTTWYVNSREASQNKPALVVDYDNPNQPDPSVAFDVGINLAAPTYWATEVPFLDLMKLSDGWHTQCNKYLAEDADCTPDTSDWDTQEQAELASRLDANGWPTSLPVANPIQPDGIKYTRVATLVPAGLSPEHPAGRIIVKYPGSGALEYRFDDGVGIVRHGFDPHDPALHRDELDVQASPGKEISCRIHVMITATDPGDPIRDVRMVPEGGLCSNDPGKTCDPADSSSTVCGAASCQSFETAVATQPFHPRFLANLRPFDLIRTMEFQNTNDSLLGEWSQRTVPSSRHWTAHDHSDGVPLEIIVQLANTLGADVWLNVSSRATDDLVAQMAGLIGTHLSSDRRVILEYANEAWNTAFSAGTWMENQGISIWPDSSEHPYVKRLNWYAKRSVEVCRIWKAAWGAIDSSRVTCVAGAQAASPNFAGTVLDCPLHAPALGHACYEDLDGLAVAPYFGHYLGSPEIPAGQTQSNVDLVAQWSLDALFEELSVGSGLLPNAPPAGALQSALNELRAQVAVARDRGLPLYGYEAGQHLVGIWSAVYNAPLAGLFTAANRDVRMGLLYHDYLTAWRECGAGPVMLFNSVGQYSAWGSWGLLEYRDQSSAASPKYRTVVQDFLNKPLP